MVEMLRPLVIRKGIMSNIYGNQPQLIDYMQQEQSFYDRRQKEKLNRQMLKAQAQQYRAKAQQALDPRYLQSQLPKSIQETLTYEGWTPDRQKTHMQLKRAQTEDYLARKGLSIDPQTGQASPIGGFAQALGTLSGGELQGQQDVRAATEPNIQADITTSKVRASDRATKEIGLNERKAVLPQLRKTLAGLSELAKIATYTKAGKFYNWSKKEVLGRGGTAGSVARAKYNAKIQNVVLPELKRTFGAAFSEAEGAKLEATLGDVDASPREKQAAIDAFLTQREHDIISLEAELGLASTAKAKSKADVLNRKSDVISYEEFLK